MEKKESIRFLFTLFLHEYKISARRRGIEWKLTNDEALGIASKNCHYCGAKPKKLKRSLTSGPNNYACTSREKLNGIDRLDPDKAYVLDNCVPACKRCNYAKMSMSARVFLNHIAKIYLHWNLNEKNKGSR